MKKIFMVSIVVAGCLHQIAVAKVPVLAASWVGLYNDEQKISLFIDQSGSKIKGYSLLNGKKTPFTGAVTANGNLVLTELGMGANVGRFDFSYNAVAQQLEGSWKSSAGGVKPKFFSIEPQQCRYAKGEGDFPVVSSRLLKDADLQVSLGELQYMRNEVYARHGYAFANKDWAKTFANLDWYMPCYTAVENRLSSIEKQNIQRIKLVEPYAKDADWGR